jgi:hypothetical protein
MSYPSVNYELLTPVNFIKRSVEVYPEKIALVNCSRGAYLNSVGDCLEMGLRSDSVYLWTLPMFHCNGWCFPRAVTVAGATHVCL